MRTIEIIRNRRKARILFAAFGAGIVSFVILLALYTAFVLFPILYIKLCLIGRLPIALVTCCVCSGSLGFFLFRFPCWGKAFYASVAEGPYTADDMFAAMELDLHKSYPPDTGGDASVTAYLSEQFSMKVAGSISGEKNILRLLFPSWKRAALLGGVIIIAVILTVVRFGLLSDIFTALRAGLPIELISVGPPLEFESITAAVQPPAYLDTGKISVYDLKKGDTVRALEGSKVIVKGRLKDMAAGRLFYATEQGLESFPADITGGVSFEASFIASLDGAFALEFDLKRAVGTISEKSRIYNIDTIPDNPPTIEIHAPPKNHRVPYANSFPIDFTVRDDYGVLEVSLYHRRAGSDEPYNRELIVRFPREAKRAYSSSYIWNPVLQEGARFDVLVYPPNTKKVEYYLEVRDTNIFSNKGITKSGMRYVSFTSVLGQFNRINEIIRELIRSGKKLLKDLDDQGMVDKYRKKLTSALDFFTKDVRDLLPQSTLPFETRKIHEILGRPKYADTEPSLTGYIEFLERFLLMLDIVKEAKKADLAMSEMSRARSELQNGSEKKALESMTYLADLLQMDFSRELDEIRRLMAKGDVEGARKKMEELLRKVHDRMQKQMQKSRDRVAKMADEAMKKLEKMTDEVKAVLPEQKRNIDMTRVEGGDLSREAQKGINQKLNDISEMAKKLAAEYPFIMSSLSSIASMAKVYGDQALIQLNNNKPGDAERSEEMVVQNLEQLLKQAAQQESMLREMKEGNFERLMPFNPQDGFVFIPKEAAYTVPVDYKEKIIEMSKKRGRSTAEKEEFWREVLE